MDTKFLARFMQKIEKREDCWLWTGSTSTKGYGLAWDGQRIQNAHRLSFEHFKGIIPEKYHVDHLCRVRSCVNPDHLEAVSASENAFRGLHGKLRTHCDRGIHEWISGQGRCLECRRPYLRKYMQQRRKERSLDNGHN